jgi:hypothetical protein
MPLVIKYIPIYAREVDTEVQFFIRYSNLRYAGKIQLTPDMEGALLKLDVNRELYLLIMPTDFLSFNLSGTPDFKIITNTSDCLKEYLVMKQNGIEFQERPQLLSLGLAARFKIADGSQCLLLEERNYNQLFTHKER